MESDILKHFVNHDVEVLIAGVWIEGHMTPIVKGIVTLLPIAGAEAFYGPTACKTDVIQAIRQVIRESTVSAPVPEAPKNIKSAFDSSPNGNRFVIGK